ncbi:MAG: type II secretion system protein J [Opitutales bacterium]
MRNLRFRHSGPTARHGFSLPEVLVALVIFSMLAVGLYSGGFWARATAMENTRRVGTVAFANGALKQIASLNANELTDLADGTDTSVPIMLSNIDNEGNFVREEVDLTIGDWTVVSLRMGTATSEEDRTRRNRGFGSDFLQVRLRPQVDSRLIDPSEPADGSFFEVTVEYQFESALPRDNVVGDSNWSPRTPIALTTVRSFVN